MRYSEPHTCNIGAMHSVAVGGGRQVSKLVTFFQVDADIMKEGLDSFFRLKEVVNGKHAGDSIILQLFPPLLLTQQGSVLKVSCDVSSCKKDNAWSCFGRLLLVASFMYGVDDTNTHLQFAGQC